MQIIDLTRPIYSGMPVYPGDPPVAVDLVRSRDQHGWDLRRLEMGTHTGTHVNVPVHMVAGGKTLDDYGPGDFCGPARLFRAGEALNPGLGYLFADRNIDAALCAQICAARPRFVGLSAEFSFEVAVERDLLAAGVICFEDLVNLDRLPAEVDFYGLPLKIRDGDASPVRAFAIIA